jgi:hypothetical protein
MPPLVPPLVLNEDLAAVLDLLPTAVLSDIKMDDEMVRWQKLCIRGHQ